MRIRDWSSDVCSSDLEPIAETIGRERKAEEGDAKQDHAKVAERAKRIAMFAQAALGSERPGEPRLLRVGEPARLGGPARQAREHDGNKQQRRNRGDDEHPLPSAQPGQAVEFEPQTAERRAYRIGKSAREQEQPDRPRPPPLRQPTAEQEKQPGAKPP